MKPWTFKTGLPKQVYPCLEKIWGI